MLYTFEGRQGHCRAKADGLRSRPVLRVQHVQHVRRIELVVQLRHLLRHAATIPAYFAREDVRIARAYPAWSPQLSDERGRASRSPGCREQLHVHE